jgi:ribosomal protein S18 acetylase RimI-like enzyme
MITFEPIASKNAKRIAVLHISGIRTGFISSLGLGFVTALYQGVAESKSSFGFVAEENGTALGFVAYTASLNRLYRCVILKKGWRFAWLLCARLFSFRTIKGILETLSYPGRTKRMHLPSAELLSIAVAEEARGKGLATTLVQKGFAECARRGIEKVKVLVGVDNEPANKFYLKCGLELASQFDNHGVLSNIYVAKIAKG